MTVQQLDQQIGATSAEFHQPERRDWSSPGGPGPDVVAVADRPIVGWARAVGGIAGLAKTLTIQSLAKAIP